MAVNDKKIEKLIEKSAQLEKRIKEYTAEKKRIDTQIKLLSYDNLKAELGSHDMTTDDYVQYARLIRKMIDNSVSFDDIDSMLDRLSDNNKTEDNNDEKEIF